MQLTSRLLSLWQVEGLVWDGSRSAVDSFSLRGTPRDNVDHLTMAHVDRCGVRHDYSPVHFVNAAATHCRAHPIRWKTVHRMRTSPSYGRRNDTKFRSARTKRQFLIVRGQTSAFVTATFHGYF